MLIRHMLVVFGAKVMARRRISCVSCYIKWISKRRGRGFAAGAHYYSAQLNKYKSLVHHILVK